MHQVDDGVVPVVIVGAGPTGMTAALLLARHGVESLVLDRRGAVYPLPRAVHLDDEVCRILGRVGVAAAFARISRPALGLRLVDRELRVLAEFTRSGEAGRHGFPQANMFDQPDLEVLLRDELVARPEVTLRENAQVTAVHQLADEVEVGYTDRLTGAASVVRARYLLGCDGANSEVRARMGSSMQTLGFEQRWLVVDVQTDVELGQWEGVHQVCDPGRAATYMRIADTRYRWEFRMLPGESLASLSSYDVVRELIRPWTPDVPDGRLTLLRVNEYTFRAQVADRWRDRRVFLLGDAAHLTPPFIGQGLGAGLRDAANLTWKVSGVLDGHLDEGCLDSYEYERKAHATAMIRLAVLLGTAMTGGGRATALIRRAIAPRLHLVPGLRARVTDSATPRLLRSTLAQRSWRRPFLGGALVPNAELPDGSRLDDVSAAFVVLTVDDLDQDGLDRRGGTLLPVGPRSVLGQWLRRRGARAAVVRPDGTVISAGASVAQVLSDLPGYFRAKPAPVAPVAPTSLSEHDTTEIA